jgi:hypothetical protein
VKFRRHTDLARAPATEEHVDDYADKLRSVGRLGNHPDERQSSEDRHYEPTVWQSLLMPVDLPRFLRPRRRAERPKR